MIVRLAPTLLALAAFAAQGTTLDFAGDICSDNVDGSGAFTTCSDFSRINSAYGDTALVNVSTIGNVNDVPGGGVMQYWTDSYSGMSDVAFGNVGATVGVKLELLGVGQLTLQSFQIGSWPDTDRNSQVTVIDLADNSVVLSTGNITVLGAVPSTFAPAVTSSVGFFIQFGPEGYNVGIDNIDYTTTPIPEPTTWALMVGGLVLVGGLARRSRG